MAGKRSIFEEVESGAVSPSKPVGGMIDQGPSGRGSGARGAIRLWLMVLFVLVVAMILLGGLTRLTDSGLSITEWKPLTGALPPMNAADWAAEFALYQAIPEFRIENSWMTLADFKQIYWWEWSHRQLGRIIGLVWALGFFWFLARRQIPTGWTGKLVLIGALGGLQGFIGWWMVSSGLTGSATDVASYRLAVHLGLAFLILGFIGWYILHLGHPERDLMQARRLREARLFSLATGWLHLAALQVLIGALVAGIDAGRSFTDWPLMGGGLLPPDMFLIEPWWRNLFENAGLVQFVHRMVGYALLAFGVMAWMRGRRAANGAVARAFQLAFVALLAQAALGIIAVLWAAPLHIALLHQLGAIVLFTLILRARFMAGYPPQQSIKRA